MAWHSLACLFLTSCVLRSFQGALAHDWPASGANSFNNSLISETLETDALLPFLQSPSESSESGERSSKSKGSNQRGTRRRSRPHTHPRVPAPADLHPFLPTPLPLLDFVNTSSGSGSASDVEARIVPPKAQSAVRVSQDAGNHYASGPIALQHFLKFRNESAVPFRLESLTTEHLRSNQSEETGSSEDHVKDILDRFKTTNSEFQLNSSEQKETDARDQGDGGMEAGVVERDRSQDFVSKPRDNQFFGLPPATSQPVRSLQLQHTLRPPHQREKAASTPDRNQGAGSKEIGANEFPGSSLFGGQKRSKDRVTLKPRQNRPDMPMDDNSSRFNEESGTGKLLESNFEVADGVPRKFSQHIKNRLTSRQPEAQTTEPPLPHTQSQVPAHESEDGRQGVPSPEEGHSKEEAKGEAGRDDEAPTPLHRQASGARGYPPAVGYDIPYPMPPHYHAPPHVHMPPMHAPPPLYPMPMPLPYLPPLPQPPVTCCRTYHAGLPAAVKPHAKHDVYSYSSNEIESMSGPVSPAKSDTSSAETHGYPMYGFEGPGETFCYQEPMLPPPLLWKQMKLQKLLYPFILKKRLFFG